MYLSLAFQLPGALLFLLYRVRMYLQSRRSGLSRWAYLQKYRRHGAYQFSLQYGQNHRHESQTNAPKQCQYHLYDQTLYYGLQMYCL